MGTLETLSAPDLLSHLAALTVSDHQTTADIVACLAEIDERRLHLDLGYSSLHSFCTERFGFSEDVAYKRIRAAKAARRFPHIIELLATGDISLSGIVTLAPVLDDSPQLLDQAKGLSSRQIESLVAARHPDRNSPRGHHRIRPVGERIFKLEVVLTQDQLAKLEKARGLCRHRNPEGDLAQLVEQGIDLLIAKVEKERFAITDRPRSTGRAAKTETMTAQVRREIYQRDQAGCAFVGVDGHRCGSTEFVQIDHIVPEALGGASTTTNGRLTCFAHNQHLARQVFGEEHVDSARAERAAKAAERTALRADCELALRTLDFSAKQSRDATRRAASSVGEDASLEDVIRAALRILFRSARGT